MSRRVKILRSESGMTQAQAAEAMGLPRATYANHEKDPSKLDILALTELARFYKVDPRELIPTDISLASSTPNSRPGMAEDASQFIRDDAGAAAIIQQGREAQALVLKIEDDLVRANILNLLRSLTN